MAKVLIGDGGSIVVALALEPERPDVAFAEGLAETTAVGSVVVSPIGRFDGGDDAVWLLDPEPATLREHGFRADAVEPTVQLEPPDGVRIVAVSAATTGSGKTALTRRIVRGLRRSGVGVAAVRHPTPNRWLWPDLEAVEVIRDLGALGFKRPFEELEELTPVVATGCAVVVGTDPRGMLEAAAAEADVVVWDGGGAARPWIRADIHVVVVDPMRDLPDALQARVAGAHAVVLTKADSAPRDRVVAAEQEIRHWNPDAQVLLADMPVAVPQSTELMRRRVVVVEDWPSLLLGGLKAGAGALAAKRFRCGVVDPRPYAVGTISRALEQHPHIGPVIPSLGRTPDELDDLRTSIADTPGDAVLWASTASPAGICDPHQRPVIGAFAELMEVAGGSLADVMRPLLPGGAG